MNLGPTELIIIAVWLLAWVVPIWAVVDAARRGDDQFGVVGQSRGTWLVLMILTAVFCGWIGTFFALYYLIAVRPKLSAVPPV